MERTIVTLVQAGSAVNASKVDWLGTHIGWVAGNPDWRLSWLSSGKW